jgi:hypothetical protein
MRLLFPAILLFSCVALAQTTAKPAPPTVLNPAETAAPAKPADISPAAPVITVEGFCPGKQATGPDCKTEVSRAEFDKLAHALNPNMPDQTKRQLANVYWRMVVMTYFAKEKGIDKSTLAKETIPEVLRFTEMQALSQLLARQLQEDAANVSAADVQKYYSEHQGNYSVASLQRIFIPKMPASPQDKVNEAAAKAEGQKIATAAKAPDADFTKLQKQAYEDLKVSATPPPVDLKDIHRDNIPAGQAKAFDLPPGQVSEAIDEPGGVYIYKVISKKTMTEAEVEPDIRKTLAQERMQASMEKLIGGMKADFNEAYFGGGTGESQIGPMSRPPQNSAPPSITAKPPAASKAPVTAPKSSTAPKTPK